MSAWYIFSALGFYPVTPGSNQYIIGAPLFDEASINLENGNTFNIVKKGTGTYVSEVNYAFAKEEQPQAFNTSYINHSLIMKGGTLTFTMSEEPASWGTQQEELPHTTIKDHLIISAPFIKSGEIAFAQENSIELASIDTTSTIFYALGNDEFKKYTGPIKVSKSTTLHTYAAHQGKKSATITTALYKYDDQLQVTLKHRYANEYSAGGKNAVIDGMKGTLDFRCGAWQGTQNENLDIMIDLGRLKTIREISTQFLKDQRSWIFYPKEVEVVLLDQDKKVVQHKSVTLPVTGPEEISAIEPVNIKFSSNVPVRYVQLKALTSGDLPEWHLGYESQGTAWTFIDEITID
jgi:hypothetical protein